MPSFSSSPGVLQAASGLTTFSPPRFSANRARLRVTSGQTTFSIIAAATVPRIERLRRYEDRHGGLVQVTAREQIVQQRNAEGIENAFQQVNNNIAAIEATLNLALAALASATSVDNRISIEGSYTNPTSVLTATSSGVITIASHARVYGDSANTSVSVTGNTLSGFSAGSVVTVYYSDAGRAGGAVTYQSSTNAVAQTGNVHVVGTVTIPGAGDPPVSGTSPTAPGVVTERTTPTGYEEL